MDGILGDAEVHKVREEGVVGESVDSWNPSIRMLGLENLTDGFPGFLVDVIGIEDSAFFPIRQKSDGSSNVALQNLLMEGLGSLLGRGGAGRPNFDSRSLT